MKQDLYKTTITVEVLSTRPLVYSDGYDLGLQDIAEEISYGDFSGIITSRKVEMLDRIQMAEALLKQGSDPAFLLEND